MDGDEEQAGRYRQRAKDLRKIAAATTDKASRVILTQVAEDYERMARARDSVAKWEKKVDRE